MSAAAEQLCEWLGEQQKRLTASYLCESVLEAYESVFDDDLRARMAICVTRDIATGMLDNDRDIANVQEWSRAMVDDAVIALNNAGMASCARHYAALRVAEAIVLSLSPIVDLVAVQKAIDEAEEYGEFRRPH